VELLAAPQNNVFVVGDEDQSIYGFRGADFRNVLRFRESYPEAQVILLEQNYRSTQIVLDAARAVIDKNTFRTPKALFTTRRDGEKIDVHEAYDADFEARYVLDQTRELMKNAKLTWNDFAVMYRTNAQSRALEESCIRDGIPYKLVGGIGFYQRREIRDLMAYLRVVNNGNDKVSFSRIINTPRRGIGQKSLVEFQYWAAQKCENYDAALQKLLDGEENPLPARTAKNFADFARLLQKWREIARSGNLVELLDAILEDINYWRHLKESSDTAEQAIDREENVQELRTLVARSQEEGDPLGDFLAEQSLLTDIDMLDEFADAVTLLTLHAAKGLEFPVVFITGVEEGLLPHARSMDNPAEMAEERRLFYVGITRAKDRLFLTHAFRRSVYGNSTTNLPSRFLGDMPLELIEGISPKTSVESQIRNLHERITAQSRRETAPTTKDDVAARRGQLPAPVQNLATRFQMNDRVRHEQFGPGQVIESKIQSGVELVTVVFMNKKHGIKRLDGAMLRPMIE